MWWWPSIDDMQRTRQAFESATTKGTIYFLLGMALLSGGLAILGFVRLQMNQIQEPIVLTVTGVIGFAFFFPWFVVTYFSRHFLLTVRALEREIERLRNAIGEGGDDTD